MPMESQERCCERPERACIRRFDWGMIAQECALQYPKRVRSLIWGCTAAGGPQVASALLVIRPESDEVSVE
jgi:hypothetical protein